MTESNWLSEKFQEQRPHLKAVRHQKTHPSPLEPSTDAFLIAQPLLSKGLFQLFFFSPDQQIHDWNMEGRDEKCRRRSQHQGSAEEKKHVCTHDKWDSTKST